MDRTIDLQGHILAPGYIDAQINGAYGVDFSCHDEGDAEYIKALNKVSTTIVETGTTSYVPTVITQRRELYQTVSSALLPASLLGLTRGAFAALATTEASLDRRRCSRTRLPRRR